MNENLKKVPKVLVGAPIFDGMKYCLSRFLNGVRSFSYSNYDILLVDNSRTNNFYEELEREEGIMVVKDKTLEAENLKRVVSSRNIIIDYALKNNYDFIFMMDADVVAPANALSDLVELGRDVVSGIYFNYFQSGKEVKLLPVAFTSLTPDEFTEIKRNVYLPDHVKSNRDLRRHLTMDEVKSGKCLPVLYPSAGCMLISRDVFQKAKYGLIQLPGNLVSGDDIYFIEEVRKHGFGIWCATGILCDHLIQGKFTKGSDGSLQNPLYNMS